MHPCARHRQGSEYQQSKDWVESAPVINSIRSHLHRKHPVRQDDIRSPVTPTPECISNRDNHDTYAICSKLHKTTMHSSRMHTIRCNRDLVGVSVWGECLHKGAVCTGGVYPCRVSTWGGICLGACTPSPYGQNSWHTLVKTLPFCNFVCRW